MKNLCSLLILVFFLLGCNEVKNSKSLMLDIDLLVKENDSINIYYTLTDSINFTDKNSIWTQVKGSAKNQTINVFFPDSLQPKQIRIDLGRNTTNKEIVLNKISLSYLNASFEAKGEEIYWYFRPDENNTILDKKSGILQRKDSTQINGPSLYPKGDKLREQLNLLYKKENNVQ